MIENTFVTVVGGGPCGLVLAWELMKRGVPVVLLEQSFTTSDHPKTQTTHGRTMELWRRFGIADKLRSQGIPPDYPLDSIFLTTLVGCGRSPSTPVSADIEFARFAVEKGWDTPEPRCQVTQKVIEATFYEEACKMNPTAVRFGHRMTSFVVPHIPSESIVINYTNLLDGSTHTIHSNYLVGCDGPSSMTRKTLGFSFEGEIDTNKGTIMRGTMLAIQFRAPTLRSFCNNLGLMHWIFNDNIKGVILALNNSDLFILHVTPPGDVAVGDTKDAEKKQLTEALCVQLVRKAVGVEEFSVEIVKFETWMSGYAVTANHYQDASLRVFLAGDAAHLFTPTGAYGMNTGIGDVADLSWKLQAMYEKWGGENLMSTYEIERQPISHRNTAIAIKVARELSTLVPPSGIQKDINMQLEYSQKIRASDVHPLQHSIQFGYRYKSPIIISTNNQNDITTSELPIAIPGGRLPHFRIAGESIYDKLSKHFTLLKFAKTNTDSLVNAATSQGVPLKVIEAEDARQKAVFSSSLVLVRPDQHIAWLGEELSNTEANEIIATITGHRL